MLKTIVLLLSFQISFGATSDKFSDKLLYPSFFRTVPSDKWQVDAIALLLREFNWNWVAVVGSEEEYGQQGVQQFSKIAEKMSVCVAYQGLIPVYTDPLPAIRTIINNILATNVGVVVVFSLAEPAETFFKEVRQCGTTRYIAVTLTDSGGECIRKHFTQVKIQINRQTCLSEHKTTAWTFSSWVKVSVLLFKVPYCDVWCNNKLGTLGILVPQCNDFGNSEDSLIIDLVCLPAAHSLVLLASWHNYHSCTCGGKSVITSEMTAFQLTVMSTFTTTKGKH